jgi:hypothetical protein
MASYKRDFSKSKKVKRNIRKNTKTRKTYKKRISYKNKRRNGNKSKKAGGGWPLFSLSSNSSDSGKTTISSSSSNSNSSTNSNTDYENNIRINMKEPFVLKNDMVLLIKKQITYDRNDTDPNKISKRLSQYNKYREYDLRGCNKLSSPSNKECIIMHTLYHNKASQVYAYDRGPVFKSLKVYLPENKNYRLYLDPDQTATISAYDFDIIPIREVTDSTKVTGPTLTIPDINGNPKLVEVIVRNDDEKRQILKKNINANLMSIQNV